MKRFFPASLIFSLLAVMLLWLLTGTQLKAIGQRIDSVLAQVGEIQEAQRPMSVDVMVVNPFTGECMTVTINVPWNDDPEAMVRALNAALEALYALYEPWKK